MSFVGYIYHKLSWTTGRMDGADVNGLGGKPAQVFPKHSYITKHYV